MTFEAPPDFAAIERDRARYKNAELAPRTISSYAADWRVFCSWCAVSKLRSLPSSEETIERYLTDLLRRGRKVATAERHCTGIRHHHARAGHPDPCGSQVRKLLSGARRIRCELPAQKTAIETRDIRAMLRLPHKRLADARNRALVVFGYVTALRRSTLARLRVEDVQFTREGFLVDVRHEKQDRRGDGRRIAVPYGKHARTCPVRILKQWLKVRGKVDGALFCNCLNGVSTGTHMLGNRITQIVQDLAEAIGLERKRYGAHSLRAGFATTALANGAGEIMVARQTGHASLDTLRVYERSRNLFRGNAASLIGL